MTTSINFMGPSKSFVGPPNDIGKCFAEYVSQHIANIYLISPNNPDETPTFRITFIDNSVLMVKAMYDFEQNEWIPRCASFSYGEEEKS